jgi:hypothetical protein
MEMWMYRSTFSWPRHWLEMSGQLCAPATLPLGKSPRHPLYRRLGGPQSRLDDMEKWKFLTLHGLKLRPLGRPARSQLPYWLRYPGSNNFLYLSQNPSSSFPLFLWLSSPSEIFCDGCAMKLRTQTFMHIIIPPYRITVFAHVSYIMIWNNRFIYKHVISKSIKVLVYSNFCMLTHTWLSESLVGLSPTFRKSPISLLLCSSNQIKVILKF